MVRSSCRDSGERVSVLETDVHGLIGNGRPGRVDHLNYAIQKLKQWRWWMVGTAPAGPIASDASWLPTKCPTACPHAYSIFRKICHVVAGSETGPNTAAVARFLRNGAGSTGRCNTGLQFTRWRFKAQSLSRALIEAQSYLVEIGLSVTGQVGFLREVLS